ncbi:hypothetical protein [Sphingomonas sp. Root241]|uniref:hypothetical protein n=1 Tax=Sphingomonas sp. Root241 TaxID=1736501 RepID=UPI000A6D613B|nr:hypothetical protein [Sphingomonas sp. Root241]
MTYRPRRSPIWLALGTLSWIAAMLGSMFVWAMYAGVAYRSDDPIIDSGLLVILAFFFVTYILAVWLIVRIVRKL